MQDTCLLHVMRSPSSGHSWLQPQPVASFSFRGEVSKAGSLKLAGEQGGQQLAKVSARCTRTSRLSRLLFGEHGPVHWHFAPL